MSEQELCESYGVDWHGPYAYEAVDRLELLLRYKSAEYLDRVSFRGEYATEFEFASERRYAEEAEQWANERDLEQVARLAQQVTVRLEALAQFSRKLAKQVQQEVMAAMEESHDLRDWSIRLQEGDFDPSKVIHAINGVAQDDPESGEIYADAYMESMYPFIAGVVIDAQSCFDGNLGHALAARFERPPQGVWSHYRGYCIHSRQVAGSVSSDAPQVAFVAQVVCEPEDDAVGLHAHGATAAEALLHCRAHIDEHCSQRSDPA